jgi:hypothetical protein
MDNDLEDKAAEAALRTRPTGAAAGGRRPCRCCLLAETPRTYRDTPEALLVFTGRCNECRRRSVGQEANGRVAVPPSLKGLVGLLYERSPKKCKEAGGAQNDGTAFPLRPSKRSQAGTIFSLRADTKSGECRHGQQA